MHICDCIYIDIINKQLTHIYYVNTNFWMRLIAINRLTALLSSNMTKCYIPFFYVRVEGKIKDALLNCAFFPAYLVLGGLIHSNESVLECLINSGESVYSKWSFLLICTIVKLTNFSALVHPKWLVLSSADLKRAQSNFWKTILITVSDRVPNHSCSQSAVRGVSCTDRKKRALYLSAQDGY